MTLLLWCLGAYLAGSIPFALILGKTRGIDIRTVGSGNVGATNLGRALGGRYFAACFALDVLKGLAPTLAFGVLQGTVRDGPGSAGEMLAWLAVMVCPVLGHMFSPWINFKGGKGVATGLGSLLGVFPLLTGAGLAAAALWGLSVKLTRYVGVSSAAAAASLPIWASIGIVVLGLDWRAAWPAVAVTGALGALVCLKHAGNIRRTLAGTEPRVGDPPKTPTVQNEGSP